MHRVFLRSIGLLMVLAMAGWAGAEPADQAAKDFEELFGRQIREGQGTRSPVADVALARRICEATRGASLSDELLTLMCENAHRLASPHAGGLDLAAEALQMLARKVPAKADECSRKLLDVQIRRFALAQGALKMQLGEECVGGLLDLADEKAALRQTTEAVKLLRQAEHIARENRSDTVRLVQVRLKEVELSEAAWSRVESLRAQLRANPRDRSVPGKLLMVFLVELDDPAEAGKYLTPESDEAARTYVPLAARPDKELTDPVSLELARWYVGLSDKGGPLGELTCLKRARRYYEVYLDRHATKDAVRLRAQAEWAKVEASLEALGPRPVTGWTGILRLVEVEKHARWGTWSRKGTALATTKKTNDARLTVPVRPEGSYELRGVFLRQEGTGGIRLVLPVRQTSCTVVVGDGKDSLAGLECVGGNDLRQNDTKSGSQVLTNKEPHTLYVKVVTIGDRAAVTASLDGREIVRWKGAQASLSRPKHWDTARDDMLALWADNCLAAFASLEIRMLSGRIAQVTVDETKDRRAQEERIRREKEKAAKDAKTGGDASKKKKKGTGK